MPNKISHSLNIFLYFYPCLFIFIVSKTTVDHYAEQLFLYHVKFFCIHLHCDGVKATRLSAGIFPSLINPIVKHYIYFDDSNLHFTFYITSVYICCMNYFELFEIPVSLTVDKTEIIKKIF